MATKSLSLTYLITTSTFCLMMAASGVLYLTSAGFKERFAHLGFPSYFRVELAVFKLAGVIVLLLPFPRFLKEWAFAGFFIILASAFSAPLARGDGLKKAIAPVSVAVLLAVSYIVFSIMGRK
jgi:hypothetical protein